MIVFNDNYIDVLDLSYFIIKRCDDKNIYIDNFELQNILYLTQVYFIEKVYMKLFNDNFIAWSIGPVIPKVYYHFNMFGSLPILLFNDVDKSNIEAKIMQNKLLLKVIDENVCFVKEKPLWKLIEGIKYKNGPWYNAYHYTNDNIVNFNVN